jgi:hypothetical protein
MERSEAKNASTADEKAQPGADGRKVRPYQKPTLRFFGSLSTLTQGTGSDSNESGSAEDMSFLRTTGSSDRAIKTAIVKIGTHPLGIGLYLFDYKADYQAACGTGRQFGVMADEVEQVIPEAVSMGHDGYKVVDYGMLGIRRYVH